jgi:hypothetical protein
VPVRWRRIAGLRRVITIAVVVGTALAGWGIAARKGRAEVARVLPTTQSVFVTDIQPLLSTYCLDCHNPDKSKGDLDLTIFKTVGDIKGSEQTFIEIADRIEQFEMPPKKSKQPTAVERAKITAWVTSYVPSQLDCSEGAREKALMHQHGGVMSRRMNRTEYNNTVRDLIGLDLKPADAFPADGSGGEGFDNNGDALFVSSMLLEKYLAAAERIISAGLAADAGADPVAGADPGAAVGHKLLIAMPGPQLTAKEAARAVIANFARRAFRRPVADAEVDRFLALFNLARQRGEPFEKAIKLPLEGVLISPHFLFLVETEPSKQGIYRVNDFVLATRLSYYLWSSMPDEELFSLAAAGRLHGDEVLKQQVWRMMKDPRSKAMTENFATQWLGIGEVGESIRPSRQKFPEYDDELAGLMKQETILFFDAILREDRSLLELLDCDYTFANERLAKLYGIADVKGPEMRRVKVVDRSRGGILGMASILTATSFPLRTSPVLRGKWVMESILGGKVPPPPPEAGTLPKDDAKEKGLTFRQRLEKHRSKPECSSCHQKMDPLGFGLENFDPVGRWRDKSGGEAVDASGEMPNGDKFTGPRELKDVLLKRKDEFLRNFSRKMLGYALGRGLNQYDQCVIADATAALSKSDYHPSALIEQIVLSRAFQYRYAGK